MTGLSSGAVALLGLVTGVMLGFTARRARLCTLGAIESALVGGDWRWMKIFGLAFAIALIGTQTMIFNGWVDEAQSRYLPTKLAIVAIIIGSLMFGVGMALVGTCAFGNLIRLGAGDLRSLVGLIIFAVVALMTLRGSLAFIRLDWIESLVWHPPNEQHASLIALLESWSGMNMRAWLTAAISLPLVLFVALDRRLRKSPRLLIAAATLGLAVVAGWAATGPLADDFAQLRLQSLTFVAPVARGFSGLIFGTDWLEFSILTVPGIVIGSFLAAVLAGEFRWEAFDDHLEMRRHLLGACLMGIGGVLAGGCTIGQGITAGSMLALSWPIAVLGMMAGAWVGLTLLVEGSVRECITTRFDRIRRYKRREA
jgi:uncharacterized membrane protein YedE/YeeE